MAEMTVHHGRKQLQFVKSINSAQLLFPTLHKRMCKKCDELRLGFGLGLAEWQN